jgi:hypothetical protein
VDVLVGRSERPVITNSRGSRVAAWTLFDVAGAVRRDAVSVVACAAGTGLGRRVEASLWGLLVTQARASEEVTKKLRMGVPKSFELRRMTWVFHCHVPMMV